MSPEELAERIMPQQEHGDLVEAIINGSGGLIPPRPSVTSVHLREKMVPFNPSLCRSHSFYITMAGLDPDADLWSAALPTYALKVRQIDKLWAPPSGLASSKTCAEAPKGTDGFSSDDFDLKESNVLFEQAREAFRAARQSRKIKVSCRAVRKACGRSPRETLAKLNWSALGTLDKVKSNGEFYYGGEARRADAVWGPSHIAFTFPYAVVGDVGATWVITVSRSPSITALRMEAPTIIYE